MKKTITAFAYFSTMLLCVISLRYAYAGFSDVPSSHSNADAINYVQSEGIVSGYPDGGYYPDKTINRAEFTKIIIKAEFDDSEIADCIANSTQENWSYVFFPDVPKDAWFAKYVCVAKANNVVGGYPDGTFKPADNINFAEAAKIIVNASGYQVGTDPVWYKPYVQALSEDAAIPVSITSLSKAITRGDMAEIVYRIRAEIYDKDSMEFTDNELVAPEGINTNAIEPNAPTPPSDPGLPVSSDYTPTHYVGKTNCSDSGAGSQSQPFCHIQAGLDALSAGDVLMILDGVYEERVYMARSGTKSKPIVITGESENAILDAGCASFPCDYNKIKGSYYIEAEDEYLTSGFVMNDQSYVTLNGFTVRNAPWYGVEVNRSTGLTLKNMTIQNAVASLVNIYDSFDLKVLNNTLSGAHLGRYTTKGVLVNYPPEEAMSIVNTDGFEIAYNSMHDGMKEGINPKVGSRNGKVHHNTIRRFCAVGIYLTEADNVDVYSNTISDIGYFKKDGKVQRCNDILSGTINTEYNFDEVITTEGGYGYEVGTGIMLAVGDLEPGIEKGTLRNVNIYNNVVSNVNVNCLASWDQIRENTLTKSGSFEDVHIYNNTFYNCNLSKSGYGPAITLDKSSKRFEIYNNIFMGASDGIEDNGSAGSNISHNLFYNTDSSAGTDNVESDPQFTNASAGDFTLKSGSPAIDAGTDVGLPFNGSKPDIGAFEK